MLNLKRLKINKKIFSSKWLLILLILGTSGWVVTEQHQKARTVTFIIPAGTGQQLEAGEEVVQFPNELVFTIGVQDTIVIENQDNVVHTFGPFVLLPHTTLTKRFDTVRTYETTCTFHKDQQMKLVINAAPWNIFR